MTDASFHPQQNLTILYRPTGIKELELIFRSGMKTFPPRLPEQPIFYPVMNQEYAAQIARDWNTKSGPGFIGFVLSFEVETEYVAKFTIQTVGARQHQELWIPAEELDECNRHIIGRIKILEIYRGPGCTIEIDDNLLLPKAWITSTQTK